MHLPSQRKRTRLGLSFAVILASSALVLTGCTSGTTAAAKGGAAKASSITINGSTGTMTENFNPLSFTALPGTLGVLYEPLYFYNLTSSGPPTPELATAFAWNADGTVLTITTRKGAQWSDGQAFTAKDVAFTFNLIAKTPALNTSGINATATATDDTTAVLTFTTPSFMQEAQVLGNQAIIPEHIWSKIAAPTTETNKTPVGTGPYTLTSFNPQSYLLTKNAHYWDKGKPQIDTVRYIALAGADAASAALLGDKVDWMGAFLPNLNALLKSHKEISYVNTPVNTTALFTCSNVALGCTGPQTDVAVRQAIYAALDRGQINKLAGGGFAGEASPTMILPVRDKKWISNPADVVIPQKADAAKATSILQAAGYTKGSDGFYQKNGTRVSLTVQVVAGWSDFISAIDVMTTELKAVGIELKSTQVAWNEWNDAETKGTFQLSLDSIGLGASSNPYFTYQPKYSTANTAKVGQAAANSGNFARYSNPVVDAALTKAAATNDTTAQAAQFAIVQKEIVRDLPYIPIYVNSTLTEFNLTNATGWPTNTNTYAFPAPWKTWDNGIVLKELKPVK